MSNSMQKIKILIKYIMGFIRCKVAGVQYPGKVYVGRQVHFANGRKIRLGQGVQIRPEVDLFAGDVFVIGKGCDIGTRNRIVGNIIIENNVLFGPDNYISSEDHAFADIHTPIMFQGTNPGKRNGHDELKIGEGSWIGTHVAIIGDVHIGRNCVVGANAVVTRDIPDYCVAVGIPAKVIKKYNVETLTWENVSRI